MRCNVMSLKFIDPQGLKNVEMDLGILDSMPPVSASFSKTRVSSHLNWPEEYPLEEMRTDPVDLLDTESIRFFRGRDLP